MTDTKTDAETGVDRETEFGSGSTDPHSDGGTISEPTPESELPPRRRRISSVAIIVFGFLPLMIVILGAGAGYLKFRENAVRGADVARVESVQAATETTIAMLSYSPDNAATVLPAAQDRLTGAFRDSYRDLVDDVVIPGAKEKNIAATATVAAAASMTATDTHATVMVFVNQSVIVASGAPTDTASAVEVTLDKVDSRWLVSGFEPK